MKKIFLLVLYFAGFQMMWGQAGTLDTSFAPPIDVLGHNHVSVEPAGTILASTKMANASGQYFVRRFNSSGTLLATFGPFNGDITEIYVRENGDIYISGSFTNFAGKNRLVRLTSGGTVVSTFTVAPQVTSAPQSIHRQKGITGTNSLLIWGTGYFLRINLDTGAIDNSFTAGVLGLSSAHISTVDSGPSGEIIVGGSFTSYNGTPTPHKFLKLSENGSIANTYNNLPITNWGTDDYNTKVKIDASSNVILSYTASANADGFTVVKILNSTNALDPTFNVNFDYYGPFSILEQADGKIVFSGLFGNCQQVSRNCIVRVYPDSALDLCFVPAPGLTFFNGSMIGLIEDSMLDSNGDIYICGDFPYYDGVSRPGLAKVHGNNVNTVIAADDVATVSAGLASSPLNVLTNDTYNGNPATTSNVNITVLLAPVGITISGTGKVTVASNMPIGTYTLLYQICAGGTGPCNCDTATVTINVVSLNANPDTVSLSSCTGTTFNVLTNDTYNGSTATVPPLTLSAVTTPGNGITFNTSTGVVTVPASLVPGTYTFTYLLSQAPTYGKTATVTINVTGTATAGNNNLSLFTGYTASVNVLGNDHYNSGSCSIIATAQNTVTTPVGTWPAGITISSGGIVSVAATVVPGMYTVQYQMCNPLGTVCATATVVIRVLGIIDAVNDTSSVIAGVSSTVSLIANDTYNNIAVNQSTNPVVTNVISNLPAGFTYSNGVITVTPSAAAGNYTFTYTICDVLGGGNCDTATVTIYVNGFNPGTGTGGPIYTVSRQTDDNIIFGGTFVSHNGTTVYGLGRLKPDMSLDNFNFYGTGTGSVFASALKPNNDIYIGGGFGGYSSVTQAYVALIKNTDNTVDTSFHPVFLTSSGYRVQAIAVQSDGKILVGGYFTKVNGIQRPNLVRLNEDGTVDTTFNANFTANQGVVNCIKILPNGQILVGGNFVLNGRASIVRLNPIDGSVDTSFVLTGLGIGSGGQHGTAYSFAVQPNGFIYVGGDFLLPVAGQSQKNFVRLDSNGNIDNTFICSVSDGSSGGQVRTISLTSDNRIFIGGSFSTVKGNPVNNVAIVENNSTFLSSANAGTGPGSNAQVFCSLAQLDDKIVVGGNFMTYHGVPRPAITRILPYFPPAQGRTMAPEADNQNITIYPNPSNGVFNIDLSGYDEETTLDVTVYNPLGQLIYKGHISAQGSNAIDLTGHETGNYFITMQNSLETVDKVITVKK